MTDVNMIRAKLRSAMDKIGKNNGHACPPSENNHDSALHELFVSSDAMAYWKTRHDTAKEDVIVMAGEDINDAVTGVIKLNAGTSITPVDGDLYSLVVDISRPANRLDSKALRSYLKVQMGLDGDAVDAAFDACHTQSAPARKFKVSSK